jgi:hypothetical protein
MNAAMTDLYPSDQYRFADLLTDAERAVLQKLRAVLDAEVRPLLDEYWERGEFPLQVLPDLIALDLMNAGDGPLYTGFRNFELARTDASIATMYNARSRRCSRWAPCCTRAALRPVRPAPGAGGRDRRLGGAGVPDVRPVGLGQRRADRARLRDRPPAPVADVRPARRVHLRAVRHQVPLHRASLGYQLATLLGGGFTPTILAALAKGSGGDIAPVAGSSSPWA